MKISILTLVLALFVGPAQAGNDPLKKVAKQLAKSIKLEKDVKVGILAFPYHDGKLSSGSSIVSERLTTHMVFLKGIRVVERSLVTSLLKEQHMSETGVIDPRTASKLGQILGVDVIVTGTLIDLGDEKTEVNARGLMADSGEIVAASRSVIKTTWKDKPRFEREKYIYTDREHRQSEARENQNEAIEVGVPMSRGKGRYRSRGRLGGTYRGDR